MARKYHAVTLVSGVPERPRQIVRIAYAGSRHEVWAQYDDSAGVIETFASDEGTDYLGCHDDMVQAQRFAHDWIIERLND